MFAESMTSKMKYILLILFCFILKQDLEAQIVPPPATQAEVDAGVNRFKYVSPYTLNGWSGGGGGVSATTVTNIVTNGISQAMSTNSFDLQPNKIGFKGLIQGNDSLEFWDDFDRSLTNHLGVAPSGHPWMFRATGPNTNSVYTEEGFYKLSTNTIAGAAYWGVTNRNPVSKWTKIGGTFRFKQWPDANGYEDGLGLLVATNLNPFTGSQKWLHVGVLNNGFYIQKELGTFITNITSFGGGTLTNLGFIELNFVSNNIVVKYNDKVFIVYDSEIGTVYTPPVGKACVIFELSRQLTNTLSQYWCEWGSAYAGFADPGLISQYARSMVIGNEGYINSITLATDDAYGVGWNGSLAVPTKNALYDKFETISGGSGGTNFPGIIQQLGNTNYALQSGKRTFHYMSTNADAGMDIDLAVLVNGQTFKEYTTNSGSSPITRTVSTNGVAILFYEGVDATNTFTGFTVPAGSIVGAEWTYFEGMWLRERTTGPELKLQVENGLTVRTNGFNLFLSGGKYYTNLLDGNMVISASLDVTANITNAVAGNRTIALHQPVIGTSGSLSFVSDGSARTITVLCTNALITFLSTNDLANSTNLLTTASKRSLLCWRVGMGNDGVSTNITMWVKNQTP